MGYRHGSLCPEGYPDRAGVHSIGRRNAAAGEIAFGHPGGFQDRAGSTQRSFPDGSA